MIRKWTAKRWREFIDKEGVDSINAYAIVDDLEKAEKRIKELNKQVKALKSGRVFSGVTKIPKGSMTYRAE